jgi:ubiquitin carboxyl-terminal hydrolase 47
LKQGDLVYELYAVLVHSGSAIGGHYYAYIKSFDDGNWYNFNDSTVTPITLEDVTKVFGDGRGSATAYMLKYR